LESFGTVALCPRSGAPIGTLLYHRGPGKKGRGGGSGWRRMVKAPASIWSLPFCIVLIIFL
jgi:hypothetical protein